MNLPFPLQSNSIFFYHLILSLRDDIDKLHSIFYLIQFYPSILGPISYNEQ